MAETKKKSTTGKKTAKASAASDRKKKQSGVGVAHKQEQPKHIGIVQRDPWLEPFEDAIRGRHDHAGWKTT